MTTTGAPNQKYVATDKPDLVSGKYSSHTHSFSLTKDDMPTIVENTENFSDSSQIVCASVASDKPDYFRQAIKMWNYIKGKADAVYAALSHTHTVSQITDFPKFAKASVVDMDGMAFADSAQELAWADSDKVLEEAILTGVSLNSSQISDNYSVPVATGEGSRPVPLDTLAEYVNGKQEAATLLSGDVFMRGNISLYYDDNSIKEVSLPSLSGYSVSQGTRYFGVIKTKTQLNLPGERKSLANLTKIEFPGQYATIEKYCQAIILYQKTSSEMAILLPEIVITGNPPTFVPAFVYSPSGPNTNAYSIRFI